MAARWRPADGERAIFRRRRCPRMLHRRRRFCSKRLFFGALVSEAKVYKPEEYNCQMNEVVSNRCKRNERAKRAHSLY